MRRYKAIAGEVGVYHCITRVVQGEMRLDRDGREVLRKQIWQVAEFCGVEVLTYAIMSNHVHILVRVGPVGVVSNEELARRLEVLYGRDLRAQTWAKWLREPGGLGEGIREKLLGRMHDVSGYMKELKQRFSLWYNRRHGSFGTLWSGRFKSLLVEPTSGAVEVVAAYIDLNAVRAGLCRRPEDYRWCGYGEAMGGSGRARRGLAAAVRTLAPDKAWAGVQRTYQRLLIERGPTVGVFKGHAGPAGVPLAQALRCRVRYFTDGAVLGSRAYLQRWFEAHRSKLCPKRRGGPRPLRGSLAGLNFTVYRDLRRE